MGGMEAEGVMMTIHMRCMMMMLMNDRDHEDEDDLTNMNDNE